MISKIYSRWCYRLWNAPAGSRELKAARWHVNRIAHMYYGQRTTI